MRETKRLPVNKPKTPGCGLMGRIDSASFNLFFSQSLTFDADGLLSLASINTTSFRPR